MHLFDQLGIVNALNVLDSLLKHLPNCIGIR
jgi:hypothetical protein